MASMPVVTHLPMSSNTFLTYYVREYLYIHIKNNDMCSQHVYRNWLLRFTEKRQKTNKTIKRSENRQQRNGRNWKRVGIRDVQIYTQNIHIGNNGLNKSSVSVSLLVASLASLVPYSMPNSPISCMRYGRLKSKNGTGYMKIGITLAVFLLSICIYILHIAISLIDRFNVKWHQQPTAAAATHNIDTQHI